MELKFHEERSDIFISFGSDIIFTLLDDDTASNFDYKNVQLSIWK